jgi:hypothetical protein
MNEADAVPGDIIETPNGNRYLVLPNDQLAYIGNRILTKSTGLIAKTGAVCRRLGRMTLPQYRKDDETLEDYWSDVQGIKRIPVQLPNGCTCTDTALMDVVRCPVHRVTALAPDITDKAVAWIQEKIREKAHELLSKHFSETLELEIGVELQGRKPSQAGLASQRHGVTIRLLNGDSEMVSST